jgi:ABC-type Mn2+/Zn2+ transport system permease subunit
VRTIEYLTGPEAALFLPGVWAGAAIGLLCGLLSPLIVLRRLAFVGQGISHAALAGVGVAAILGVGGFAATGIAAVVCLGAGAGVALLSGRLREREDTAIGVFLVVSMAIGALMLAYRAQRPLDGAPIAPTWESLLFGSILAVGPPEAWFSWLALLGSASILWCFRRPLIFWAFDDSAARAFGVPAGGMRFLLLIVCALAIVITMRLAGVVLATALLVLPGAIALRVSQRLRNSAAISCGAALLGIAGGIVLGFESDLPPGACIVLVLGVLYACAHFWAGIQRRRALTMGKTTA